MLAAFPVVLLAAFLVVHPVAFPVDFPDRKVAPLPVQVSPAECPGAFRVGSLVQAGLPPVFPVEHPTTASVEERIPVMLAPM